MAAKKTSKKKSGAKKPPETESSRAVARPESTLLTNPFSAMRRLSDEMERMFRGIGFGDFRFPELGRDFEFSGLWGPDVDMFERKGQLVIRADLPGLSKEDVKVDITDGDVTIEGERKSETKEEKKGYYRSERSYGSFRRSIALPEGVKTERAKATFKDGVLEITMPKAGKRKKGGRRLSIKT